MGLFTKYFGLRGQTLSWAIGAIAGLDFLLFGYGKRSHSKQTRFLFMGNMG